MIIKNNQIDKAITALNNEEVICVPTETVMGLAIRADSNLAYQRLIDLKNRPVDKAFPLIVKSINEIEKYAYLNSKIKKVINRFMPGPLTLVLPKKEVIKNEFINCQANIAIRIPQNDILMTILERIDYPLFLTSANLSKEPPALDSYEAEGIFGNKIIIIEGKSIIKIPSTIIDVSRDEIQLLRAGSISFDEIKNIYEGA